MHCDISASVAWNCRHSSAGPEPIHTTLSCKYTSITNLSPDSVTECIRTIRTRIRKLSLTFSRGFHWGLSWINRPICTHYRITSAFSLSQGEVYSYISLPHHSSSLTHTHFVYFTYLPSLPPHLRHISATYSTPLPTHFSHTTSYPYRYFQISPAAYQYPPPHHLPAFFTTRSPSPPTPYTRSISIIIHTLTRKKAHPHTLIYLPPPFISLPPSVPATLSHHQFLLPVADGLRRVREPLLLVDRGSTLASSVLRTRWPLVNVPTSRSSLNRCSRKRTYHFCSP